MPGAMVSFPSEVSLLGCDGSKRNAENVFPLETPATSPSLLIDWAVDPVSPNPGLVFPFPDTMVRWSFFIGFIGAL